MTDDAMPRAEEARAAYVAFCPPGTARGDRSKMGPRRQSWTQKAKLRDAQGLPVTFHLGFGEYDGGRLGEVWIDASKEGTFTRGVLGALGRVVSVALQCGTPPQEVVKALRGLNFPPNGKVEHTDGDGANSPPSPVEFCSSVVDWIAQEIEAAYVGEKVPETNPTRPIV